jgi:hypothetical protein
MQPTSGAAIDRFDSKSSETSFKDLQRLRQACRIAFERYFDIASHGSGELLRLGAAAGDPVARINVRLLQRKERKAYDAYVVAKANLMEYLFGHEEESVLRSVTAEATGTLIENHR